MFERPVSGEESGEAGMPVNGVTWVEGCEMLWCAWWLVVVGGGWRVAVMSVHLVVP